MSKECLDIILVVEKVEDIGFDIFENLIVGC